MSITQQGSSKGLVTLLAIPLQEGRKSLAVAGLVSAEVVGLAVGIGRALMDEQPWWLALSGACAFGYLATCCVVGISNEMRRISINIGTGEITYEGDP